MIIEKTQVLLLVLGYTTLFIGLQRLTASLGYDIFNPKRKFGKFANLISGFIITVGGLLLLYGGTIESDLGYMAWGIVLPILGLWLIRTGLGHCEYEGMVFKYILPVKTDGKTKLKIVKVEQKFFSFVGGVLFIILGLGLLLMSLLMAL